MTTCAFSGRAAQPVGGPPTPQVSSQWVTTGAPRTDCWGRQESDFYSHRTGLCISPIGQSVRWEQGFPLFAGLREVFPEGWCQRHLKAQVRGGGGSNLGQENSQGEQQTYGEAGEGRGWKTYSCVGIRAFKSFRVHTVCAQDGTWLRKDM